MYNKFPMVLLVRRGALAALLVFLGGCIGPCSAAWMTKETIESFENYPGVYDYWRIPIKKPHQISIIDTFDHGHLDRWKPEGGGSDCLVWKITRYAFQDPYVAGVCEKGLFTFDTRSEKTEYYASEEAFRKACETAGFPKDAPLRTIQEQHDAYWSANKHVDPLQSLALILFVLVLLAAVLAVLGTMFLFAVLAVTVLVIMVTTGAGALAVVIGILNRSVSSGAKALLVQALALGGIATGAAVFWGFSFLIRLAWAPWAVLLAGALAGLAAGLLAAACILKVASWLRRKCAIPLP